MGIENERERTSSMLDSKHNVPQKPIQKIVASQILLFVEFLKGLLEDRK